MMSVWFFILFVKVGYAGGLVQVGPFTTKEECEQAKEKALANENWAASWTATSCYKGMKP